MAFDLDFRLTDQIREATGGAVWGAVITEWVVGVAADIRRVVVKPFRPLEGFGPPESLEFEWTLPGFPEPGGVVRVALGHARGYKEVRDTLWVCGLEIDRPRYVIDGSWALLPAEEAADTPHLANHGGGAALG